MGVRYVGNLDGTLLKNVATHLTSLMEVSC